MKTVSARCRDTGNQQCHLCEDKGCCDNLNETPAMVGYILTRPDFSEAWMFAGTTPEEVATAVRNELEMNQGLPADECDRIDITAFATTQAEIDSMPEFPGW